MIVSVLGPLELLPIYAPKNFRRQVKEAVLKLKSSAMEVNSITINYDEFNYDDDEFDNMDESITLHFKDSHILKLKNAHRGKLYQSFIDYVNNDPEIQRRCELKAFL